MKGSSTDNSLDPYSLNPEWIDAWFFDLNRVAISKHWLELLSKTEKIRAAGYKFELDRTRFIAHRCILRNLLGKYLNQSPEEVGLYTSSEGKLENADNKIGFSLSHSGDQVAYVLGKQKYLGIDIEQVKPIDHLTEIADRFFSPSEKSAMNKSTGVDQLQTFYHIWTQKEAFVKAIGKGLDENLQEFTVSTARERPDWEINSQDAVIKKWRIWSFKSAQGFQAAICFPDNNLNGIRFNRGVIITGSAGIDIESGECVRIEFLT